MFDTNVIKNISVAIQWNLDYTVMSNLLVLQNKSTRIEHIVPLADGSCECSHLKHLCVYSSISGPVDISLGNFFRFNPEMMI